MPEFEKISKKFALNNSYFKNRQRNHPANPFEVLDYYLEHGELPYKNGDVNDNWFYECFVEYQKRNGVINSQFFTPPKTAERIAEIAFEYADTDEKVLDACCGFGQITMALEKKGFREIQAFDIDKQLTNVCYRFTGLSVRVECCDYNDFSSIVTGFSGGYRFKMIVSNPPYEIKELTDFFDFAMKHTYPNATLVLLLPLGFIDKTSPKKLVQTLNCFEVVHREPMNEPFARTNIRAEIVVMKSAI